MNVAVCLVGHFRTFDKVHTGWKEFASRYNVDYYFSTWDTIDSDTKAWHKENGGNPPLLNENQLSLLRSYDPHVTIEHQEWTDEERNDIFINVPSKFFRYRYQQYNNIVQRILVSPKKYSAILFSRFDVSIHRIVLPPLLHGEICIGYREDTAYIHSLAASDIFFMIHPEDIELLCKPHKSLLELRSKNTYTKPEDFANDYYHTLWFKVTRIWKYGRDFQLVRLGS